MVILLVCSKANYNRLEYYKRVLEDNGHKVIMPNCADAPQTESLYRNTPEHAKWKAGMIRASEEKIKESDAVLCLNFDKGEYKNYIGGATFLELYDAFRLNKKIFFVNDIPEGILKDELIGFSPIVIHNDTRLIK